jgi:hypothetical protein
MEAQERCLVDEELTARMFFKLASAESQRPARRRALMSAAISSNFKSFTTVKKLREVGGTAANNPLPGTRRKRLVRRGNGENTAASSP